MFFGRSFSKITQYLSIALTIANAVSSSPFVQEDSVSRLLDANTILLSRDLPDDDSTQLGLPDVVCHNRIVGLKPVNALDCDWVIRNIILKFGPQFKELQWGYSPGAQVTLPVDWTHDHCSIFVANLDESAIDFFNLLLVANTARRIVSNCVRGKSTAPFGGSSDVGHHKGFYVGVQHPSGRLGSSVSNNGSNSVLSKRDSCPTANPAPIPVRCLFSSNFTAPAGRQSDCQSLVTNFHFGALSSRHPSDSSSPDADGNGATSVSTTVSTSSTTMENIQDPDGIPAYTLDKPLTRSFKTCRLTINKTQIGETSSSDLSISNTSSVDALSQSVSYSPTAHGARPENTSINVSTDTAISLAYDLTTRCAAADKVPGGVAILSDEDGQITYLALMTVSQGRESSEEEEQLASTIEDLVNENRKK